ncbi:alpha-glucosidase, partial [Corynebacterium sp. AOP12-C2-36]|uniref:alpha-glucosidase n=1 Tax=Corynebacterium sp. AOP12-C2-36 TaxID=3457723 RepID=UPI004034F5BF
MERQWWHDKTAYQIYPKSFRDSDGDGIGDLRGIIEKLDYLEDLGVEIVWISPFFPSPLVDQGYDVSDFYGVDPVFGTMDDMDELLREARQRNIHILIDIVLNHCSDQHEWFQEALRDLEGRYADYFYFVEQAPDGSAPSNWRSTFGGSVWEKVEGTDKYFLHIFAKEQPDLNWENPEVRKEMKSMMRWWLDRGVSGFRLDAIANLKKDLDWKSFPPDRDDGLASKQKMVDSVDGLEDFFQEIKDDVFEPYGAFTVSELSSYPAAGLGEYIGDGGYFSTMFDLSTDSMEVSGKGWYDRSPVTANNYRRAIFESIREVEGTEFKANIIENHDEPRGVSNYIPEGDVDDYSKTMLAGILFMRPGIPFIYQGQEIGMENPSFASIDDYDDVFTHNEYQVAIDAGHDPEEALNLVAKYSRDNCRTPMQWSGDEGAGFTTGTPWLHASGNQRSINVASQVDDPASVLSFY